jgi:hypothetical protein
MSPHVAHGHRDEAERTMKYTVTIYDVDQPDAMPLWESFGHNSFDEACRAAQNHIDETRPGDRLVPQGHGEYAIWATDHDAQPTHVATVVIEPGDELDP